MTSPPKGGSTQSGTDRACARVATRRGALNDNMMQAMATPADASPKGMIAMKSARLAGGISGTVKAGLAPKWMRDRIAPITLEAATGPIERRA